MTVLRRFVRPRFSRDDGETASWLLLAAALVVVAAMAAGVLSHTVTELANGVVYAAGVEGPVATISPAPGTQPVRADDVLPGVAVAWQPVQGATSYVIYRNGERLGDSTSTMLIDTTAGDQSKFSVQALDATGNALDAPVDVNTRARANLRFGGPGPGETTTNNMTLHTGDVNGPGTITQSVALDGSTFELTESGPTADGQFSDRIETFPDGTTQHLTVVNGVVVNNYTKGPDGKPQPGDIVDGKKIPEPPPPPPPTNPGGGDDDDDDDRGNNNGQGNNSLTQAPDSDPVCGSCDDGGGGGYDNPDLDGHESAAG